MSYGWMWGIEFSFLYVPLFIEHYFWCVDGVVKNEGVSSKTRLEWQK